MVSRRMLVRVCAHAALPAEKVAEPRVEEAFDFVKGRVC